MRNLKSRLGAGQRGLAPRQRAVGAQRTGSPPRRAHAVVGERLLRPLGVRSSSVLAFVSCVLCCFSLCCMSLALADLTCLKCVCLCARVRVCVCVCAGVPCGEPLCSSGHHAHKCNRGGLVNRRPRDIEDVWEAIHVECGYATALQVHVPAWDRCRWRCGPCGTRRVSSGACPVCGALLAHTREEAISDVEVQSAGCLLRHCRAPRPSLALPSASRPPPPRRVRESGRGGREAHPLS